MRTINYENTLPVTTGYYKVDSKNHPKIDVTVEEFHYFSNYAEIQRGQIPLKRQHKV